MKKSVSILMVFVLIFSLASCSKGNESSTVSGTLAEHTQGRYPIKWDAQSLYADYDAWLEDYEKIQDYPEKLAQFKGKVTTVPGLLGFIELTYDEEYHAIFDKLCLYSNYGIWSFPSDPTYSKCDAKLNIYYQKLNDAAAYFDEEMGSLSFDERLALFTSDEISPYKHLFSEYLNPKKNYMSEGESKIFNILSMSRDRMNTLYNIVAYSLIPDLEYELPGGETIALNDSNYVVYLSDPEIKLETKIDIYNSWWEHTSQYADTLAYILETEMLEEYAAAKANGFESSAEYAMFRYELPDDIMDKVLSAARRGAAKHAEYFSLYAKRDGTDKYYLFSEYVPLTDYHSTPISYDDSVDTVAAALSILGDDYVDAFMTIMNSGMIDVYPAEDKSGGAFETSGSPGFTPSIMFNFEDNIDGASTIAHEGGHACYDYLASQSQPYYNLEVGIFTQEVASTVNELLFWDYMMKNAESDDEKAFYLGNLLTDWTGSFFRQCFFQEFENYCHETVEAGESLDAESMAAKWDELTKIYYGDSFDLLDFGAYRWTTLDHLYYDHYVFQYATAVCYASAIAGRILSGDENAVEDYLSFLKAGHSCSPEDALKIVGIDITDDSPYDEGLEYFYDLLDQYEALTK